MYRADSVAKTIGSLGYLVAIICSISMAMLPRAKFIESVIRNIFVVCLAAAVSILGLWCARQAKIHTQLPSNPTLYNPSAAAVAAVFVFFNVYISNVVRAVTRSI
jgi:uncharacterized membrane protein